MTVASPRVLSYSETAEVTLLKGLQIGSVGENLSLMSSLEQAIRTQATTLGFTLCGFTRLAALPREEFLTSWLAQGNAGEMHYLARHPEYRLNPTLRFPEAKSVICLGYPYAPPQLPNINWQQELRGRVAAYAAGNDYHEVIKAKLLILIESLKEMTPAYGHVRMLILDRYSNANGPIGAGSDGLAKIPCCSINRLARGSSWPRFSSTWNLKGKVFRVRIAESVRAAWPIVRPTPLRKAMSSKLLCVFPISPSNIVDRFRTSYVRRWAIGFSGAMCVRKCVPGMKSLDAHERTLSKNCFPHSLSY